MERRFSHFVEYKEGTSSIDEVIENLKAQKKLLEEGVKLIDAALANFQLDEVKIRVLKAGSGSLITDFMVYVYGSYQTDIQDAIVGGIEELFGAEIPEKYETLVTLATLAVTYFVARYAYDAVRARRPNRPPSVYIDGDYHQVINLVSERLQLPESEIENALHATVPAPRRRQLIRQVTKFLRPRDDGRPTRIEVKGYGEIPPDAISEYPTDGELAEIDDTRNIDIPNALLDIRATDKDRNNTGWAAVIVGDKRFRKRLQMDLYPTVDTEKLSKLDRVRGNIIVEGERRQDGAFRAKKIHLLDFNEETANGE
ncbi:MAG: hypothetical protein E5X86_22620 [Mesorhizobium sp.]|uniref:hypothetical protein n=1 Tax=Mesorhizobium sp. TaxID=1871066 RepID=UPI00121833FD|nr:hypothetical protein [Mesorhizobium sp.]TIO14918.1 MAG: hypothetical protein E5X86_22620 [Mesorhizobium sp.]